MHSQEELIDVAVVEDNEDEALITKMALSYIVPKPTTVVIPDGELAMSRQFGEHRLRPQVVLLDLKLPKVHGLDILSALKQDPESKEIPVLILTSSDHPRDVDRAKALGCDEYLCKPVDWEKYIHLVCTYTTRYLKDSTCALDG